jgi:hypothetical protein
MPSISRPNPGTFAAEIETEAEAGCLSEQPISHRWTGEASAAYL